MIMAYLRIENDNGEVAYINLKKVIGYQVGVNPHRISVDMEDGNTYYINGNFKCFEDADVVIQYIIEQPQISSSYIIYVPSIEEAHNWVNELHKCGR